MNWNELDCLWVVRVIYKMTISYKDGGDKIMRDNLDAMLRGGIERFTEQTAEILYNMNTFS